MISITYLTANRNAKGNRMPRTIFRDHCEDMVNERAERLLWCFNWDINDSAYAHEYIAGKDLLFYHEVSGIKRGIEP